MKKFNKKAVAVISLGALAAIGGTFAYYNQSVSLDNPLSTGNYENQLVEEYTPETDELKPGATINKKVGAINTGDYPVLVRIKMDEKWTRDNEVIISHTSEDANMEDDGTNKFAANELTDDTKEFQAVQIDGDAAETDGIIYIDEEDQDESVVRKNLTADSNWVYGNDGYWYYMYVLEPDGGYTGNLLDSITLASNIDLGYYEEHKYYAVAEAGLGDDLKALYATDDNGDDLYTWYEYIPQITTTDDEGNSTTSDFTYYDGTDWVTLSLDDDDANEDGVINEIDLAMALNIPDGDSLYRRSMSSITSDSERWGYSDANYTLTVYSEFVQATVDAVVDSWNITLGEDQTLEAYLTDLGLSIETDDSDPTLLVSPDTSDTDDGSGTGDGESGSSGDAGSGETETDASGDGN